jgi:hypothetical protein
MTHRGHVRNGQITFDEPLRFPEGAEVIVALVEPSSTNNENLNDVLLRHAAKGENLPSDLAEQHDFYAHGKPKQ